ncbi:MAG TPA: amino acid permease [Steroidobacteraceae bacterium]|nr:amino acid permease [Steroidobacteraceae bacterium]
MSQELSRALRPRHLTMISIGGIIGAGLFVGSSAAIAATGPAIVLSYLITGVLILLVMRMLGEMAVSLPNVRAFTEFARVGLGQWAGFVAGWLYWYFWIITVAVEAIAGANILHSWLPELPTWQLGLALMAVMTGVNLMSARSYGEFEFWFSSIKVSAIIVFIALAASYAFGLGSHAGPRFMHLTAHGGFMPKGPVTVLAGAVTVFFALTGAEITTIAAAESQEGSRAIARMTTSVIVRILTFYVASIFLILCVVPWDTIVVGKSPFTLALTTMNFSWASSAMSVIILTAVLSCLNSAFYVCSRVLFLLAGHGDAPQWLVQLNVRRVPTRSVWMGSLAGVIGVLSATLAPETVFAFLVNASGALMVFVYIMVAVAQIRLRRERERVGAPAPAVRMWLFPWASYAAILGMVAILVAMALTHSQAKDLYVSLVTLLVALVAYWLLRARRGAVQPAAATGP